MIDVRRFRNRRIQHVFIHALLRLSHAKVAHDIETCVQTCFFFQRFVEVDGILVDVSCRIGHVE